MQSPQRLEEDVGPPKTGVTDNYELTCECWVLNPSPLEKHPVLLPAEPSLQSPKILLKEPIGILSCRGVYTLRMSSAQAVSIVPILQLIQLRHKSQLTSR